MHERIRLSLAHMGGKELDFIQEAFDTNWVTSLGPNVTGFERDLENYLTSEKSGELYVVALNSGTSALHLGLLLLGVGAGDEVICQSFTFCASANVVGYLGARPVFVDSEARSWNMDPILLEEAIRDRLKKTGKLPKAIIPTHLYGMPADIQSILEVATRYEIPVLEDAAEAIGSEYLGQKCGTFGRYGVLSFNGNKMITTSAGGALICHSKEDAAKALYYATQARDEAPYYQHSQAGYNYRMSNICAGIGRGQMYVLEEHIERRRAIHAFYSEKLRECTGIRVMYNPDYRFQSNFWLTCIQVDPLLSQQTNLQIRKKLDAANIDSALLWKPMHLQPLFKEAPMYDNHLCDDLFSSGLCLPSGPMITDDLLNRIVETILHD
ncbi:MAG: DegT/DnrJ/EryC1/StrS family aminotransferase [Bacteroidales bacterium]|nr:DegT/DnrJ/EryC1/StrS family aminotransferase [Bacteroidales bacterium]MDD4822788.1 DegT/DnrJ/EryC1/StrS family aminotransferase [Bacteroidales bacterium]